MQFETRGDNLVHEIAVDCLLFLDDQTRRGELLWEWSYLNEDWDFLVLVHGLLQESHLTLLTRINNARIVLLLKVTVARVCVSNVDLRLGWSFRLEQYILSILAFLL